MYLMASERSRIFESAAENVLRSWLSTTSPDITDANCALAFADIIKEAHNQQTSDMWDLLRSVRLSEEKRVLAVNENAIVSLLDSYMVKGLDAAIQTRLREDPTHEVVQKAYVELNTFLYELRSKLDSEIQREIDSKSPSRQSLGERSNRKCHLM